MQQKLNGNRIYTFLDVPSQDKVAASNQKIKKISQGICTIKPIELNLRYKSKRKRAEALFTKDFTDKGK